MNLLILGGGVFLGRHVMLEALDRGHHVTVFNRGKKRVAWPPAVNVLIGDRQGDLSALEKGRWDAVVDTSGYVQQDVARTVKMLIDVGCYLYVSSVSVYESRYRKVIYEYDELVPTANLAGNNLSIESYGAQKAACEAHVLQVFGRQALVVRPGLIIGAFDPSHRFSYWPRRVAQGGSMLAPKTSQLTLQMIDVRDVSRWIVRALEADIRGIYNLTGKRSTWRTLLSECCEEVSARNMQPAEVKWVEEALLLQFGVKPWTEIPLWLPSTDFTSSGYNVSSARAWRAGLTTRPLRESIRAVLDEGLTINRLYSPITGEREVEILRKVVENERLAN